jgi:hypothetical protein
MCCTAHAMANGLWQSEAQRGFAYPQGMSKAAIRSERDASRPNNDGSGLLLDRPHIGLDEGLASIDTQPACMAPYNALAISSVIFLASPSTIMVLSR